MKLSSQLLLTFLLNACWQVALIAAFASLGSWLLRKSSVRYRHCVWATALCLAFLVPAFTSWRMLLDNAPPTTSAVPFVTEGATPLSQETALGPSGSATALPSSFQLNRTIAFALLAIYFGFLVFSSFKLIRAWRATRAIRHHATEIEYNGSVAAVIRRCELEFGTRPDAVSVCRSETLPVPVTTGLFRPIIILPESLLREDNHDLLTSAIGHEFIHVARRDYLLNLLYELLFVPISFHPAAALLRRRVRETRELCCDELVAERILNPEVYARSLVTLASPAIPLRRLSVTTTVGIADADILEARIMSLLKKPELNTRWKRSLLIVVSLLLLAPSVAAAAFAMRFDVDTNAQDPALQEKERKEKELHEKQREAEIRDVKIRRASDPRMAEEIARKQELEMEMRAVRQAALVRLAKINMDQAIQIATSQQPGKVLVCILDGKGWEEPGKLGADGVVFYNVVIADETNGGEAHVWVNAIDGTIIKSEKQLPRKKRNPEGQ